MGSGKHGVVVGIFSQQDAKDIEEAFLFSRYKIGYEVSRVLNDEGRGTPSYEIRWRFLTEAQLQQLRYYDQEEGTSVVSLVLAVQNG